MENFEIDVNQFPSLTWNFLNINRAHLEFSSEFKSCVSISGAKEIENSALYDSMESRCYNDNINFSISINRDFSLSP